MKFKTHLKKIKTLLFIEKLFVESQAVQVILSTKNPNSYQNFDCAEYFFKDKKIKLLKGI